jgi:hypothetical protein
MVFRSSSLASGSTIPVTPSTTVNTRVRIAWLRWRLLRAHLVIVLFHKELQAALASEDNHPSSAPAKANVATLTLSTRSPNFVALDSGAVRHIHSTLADFTNVTNRSPQQLQGFTGAPVRVDRHGDVGSCGEVLFCPNSATSIRSAGTVSESIT